MPPTTPPPPPTGRRTPRYVRFLVTGAGVGLLAAAVLVLVRGGVVERPMILFLYLALVLSGLGALLAAVVAVVLESRRRRTADDSP